MVFIVAMKSAAFLALAFCICTPCGGAFVALHSKSNNAFQSCQGQYQYRAESLKLSAARITYADESSQSSRRHFITGAAGAIIALENTGSWLLPQSANAEDAPTTATSTANAQVTDKIFLEIKGVPAAGGEDGEVPVVPPTTSRIVIGLFGNDQPQPVSILKQLVSPAGLPSSCKPRETRILQREQLEANKVYNSCIESGDKGVTYDLSQVWRVAKDQRIDVGSVAGKFISRDFPTFDESKSSNVLEHDIPGTVSVRRGNDGGFGFVIYPGGGIPSDLNEDNIVVGRVIEGMDVIERINDIPVVQSSKLSYKALAGGGDKLRAAPSRACRYGSADLYCNEFKPLKKLLIMSTGLL
jgi:cyclophilin family peptidyl-prolyl cis-trans isomerase